MVPTDLTVLANWLAGIQVVFGLVALVAGLHARGRPGELLAPLGAMWLIPGVSRFLSGTIPEEILIPFGVVLFAAAVVWFVHVYRASRARTRELLRQRGQAQP